MIEVLFPLVRPVLHGLDAERAHNLTLRALAALPARRPPPDDPRLAVELLGRTVPNPVGLAAGFDKGATVPDALLGLGLVSSRSAAWCRARSPATRARGCSG